ncbi:MAG: hypothetical protein ABJL67_12555 [Sulfitobacter sp.]
MLSASMARAKSASTCFSAAVICAFTDADASCACAARISVERPVPVPLQRSSAEGLSTTQVIAPDIVQGMLDGQSLNMFLTLTSGQTLKLSALLSEFVVLFGMMQTSPSPSPSPSAVDGEE